MVKVHLVYHIVMFKFLPGLKRGRITTARSLCTADEKTLSSGEVAKLTSPQSAWLSSEVIFTFENGDVLNKKKKNMHIESTEKKHDATSPKLLLPIIVALGGSECQTECPRRREP